jgi:hypothetical protein
MFLQGAWDSYVQGTGPNTMDPSIWPMNFDMSQTGDAQMPQGQSGGGGGGSGGTPNMM